MEIISIPYTVLYFIGTFMNSLEINLRLETNPLFQMDILLSIEESEQYLDFHPFLKNVIDGLIIMIIRESQSQNPDIDTILQGFFISQWRIILTKHAMYVALGHQPIAGLKRAVSSEEAGLIYEQESEKKYLLFKTKLLDQKDNEEKQ